MFEPRPLAADTAEGLRCAQLAAMLMLDDVARGTRSQPGNSFVNSLVIAGTCGERLGALLCLRDTGDGSA